MVNNETKKLEAVETVWRDFYTGQRMGIWTKPYYRTSETLFGDTYNCMRAFTDMPWNISWGEWQCIAIGNALKHGCPCSYPTQPLLELRGLCSSSLIYRQFTPMQLPSNPYNMILLGKVTSRIEFNDTTSHT